MNKSDLEKQIKVVAVQRGYYGNQIKEEGVVFYVKRHEFSENWMVHVDEKNKPYEKQPRKLRTKDVKAILEEGKEKKSSKPEFPLLTKEVLDRSQEAGLQAADTNPVSLEQVVDSEPEQEAVVDAGDASAHV